MVRQLSTPSLVAELTVVALCAEWCGTCRDYRLAFERRAAERDDARHVWIDIEDDADWLGELDVETFPTLLVLCGDEPRFYGPVLPAIDVVDRTLRALARADGRPAAIPADHRDAVARLIERVRNVR
jgi:thioredoxin 1